MRVGRMTFCYFITTSTISKALFPSDYFVGGAPFRGEGRMGEGDSWRVGRMTIWLFHNYLHNFSCFLLTSVEKVTLSRGIQDRKAVGELEG